jgi:hypothetical protein
MTSLFEKIDGYKTYGIAALGILVSLAAHFWGPFHFGPVQIPQLSWAEVWDVVWNGGLFAALRSGVTKSGPTK